MNKFSIINYFSGIIACVLGSSVQAKDKSDLDWENFRKTFPFHIQTFAISEPSSNGNQTLIISEPPPEATLEGIKAAAPALMAGAVIRTHRIGVDGWVKDVTVPYSAQSAQAS